MTSGVTFSAAQTRSPSFSRSSSSTMMTIRPSRISAAASGMEAKDIKDFRFQSCDSDLLGILTRATRICDWGVGDGMFEGSQSHLALARWPQDYQRSERF